MLKRLFYASASIFMLAAAYHLGATCATAQAVSPTVGSFGSNTDPTLVDTNGHLWVLGWTANPGARVGPITLPKSAPVLAATGVVVAAGAGATAYVLFADGDAFYRDGWTWNFVGNVFSGATPAAQPTWGEIKSKYRPGATTQDK